MGMTDFLGAKRHKDAIVDRFDDMSEGKTKEEVRALEQELFQPDPIPIYTREVSDYRINADLSMRLVVPDVEAMDLVRKFFNIGRKVEPNITDPQLFVDFLRWLDSGEITYDRDTGRFLQAAGVNSKPAPAPVPVPAKFCVRRRVL